MQLYKLVKNIKIQLISTYSLSILLSDDDCWMGLSLFLSFFTLAWLRLDACNVASVEEKNKAKIMVNNKFRKLCKKINIFQILIIS